MAGLLPPPETPPDPATGTSTGTSTDALAGVAIVASATTVRPRRAGELTSAWTVAFVAGWVGVVVGWAAVWAVSRQLGLSTWWLGPRAQPRPVPVNLLPFIPPVLLVAGAASRARYLPWSGLAGALVLAAIAAGDVARVTGIAVIELSLATAGALVSVAAWSGTYRRAGTAAR